MNENNERINSSCKMNFNNNEEFSNHFCESEESMKVCNSCEHLGYEDGVTYCKLFK